MKKLIIIAAVVCVAAVGIFLIINRMRNSVLDGPGMEYTGAVTDIYYYYGTDEYGVSTGWHLHDGQLEYRYNGGTVYQSSEMHCEVTDELYNAVEEIMTKYNVRSWTELDRSDIEILDGATTSFTITLEDGNAISLGDDYMMPENGWKAVSEIIDLFEACIKPPEHMYLYGDASSDEG